MELAKLPLGQQERHKITTTHATEVQQIKTNTILKAQARLGASGNALRRRELEWSAAMLGKVAMNNLCGARFEVLWKPRVRMRWNSNQISPVSQRSTTQDIWVRGSRLLLSWGYVVVEDGSLQGEKRARNAEC